VIPKPKTKQNNKMSQDNNNPKLALVLSTKCALRKQQLKAFAALTTHIWSFNQNSLHNWNSLPDDVRKNPKTLMIAMRSSSAYDGRGCGSVDVNAMVARARVLNTLKQERIAGINSPSILSWMGANFKYIWDFHRYDTQFWAQLMCQKRIRCGSDSLEEREQPWHDSPLCDASVLTEYCRKHHNDIHNALNWLYRNRRLRMEARSHAESVKQEQNVPASVRLQEAKQRIYQTRAIHWEQSLTHLQLNMAKRMRPSGECLGIELEFIGSKGSPITKWDSDDFDAFPFHSFKHDGSINSTDADEVVLALQEYTAFINGSNPRDWTQVFDTLKGLTNEGAIVNETCGNHVHLDMRHKSSASYYRTAGKMRDAFTTWAHRLVSYRRSHNRYCGIHNNHTSNRYTAVNTQCWSEHRTVEVRIGMPTLNPTKLKYWTRFLQYMVSDRSDVDTFDDFMNSNAPLDLKVYAVSRIKKFEATYINNSMQPLPNFKSYVDALDAVKCTEHDFISPNKSSTTT
jgi:hypothetical protein